MSRPFALLLAAAVTVAGCATGSSGTSSTPVDPPDDGTTIADGGATADASGDPSTGTAPDGDLAEVRVTLTTVGEGFEQPVDVLEDPNTGELLVAEQAGRITTLKGGEVRLDVSELTTYGGERGMLDAVFHPDGDRLYIHHSGNGGETLLAEYPVSDDGAIDADARTELFTTPQPAANHNGGSVTFGPDGALYLALGDGGRAGDAFDQAQDTSTPLGGILRFQVGGPGEVTPAEGNPFDEPRLWVYGLRNPWRIDFDGDRLFVADVGQDAVEEVSVVAADAAGANFGWPFREGDQCFREEPCDVEAVPSIVNELHADGSCSITGGVVYRGSAIPALVGTYLYTDLCAGYLKGVQVDDDLTVSARVDLTEQVDVESVVGFGTDAAGEVYLTQLDGQIRRLDPAS